MSIPPVPSRVPGDYLPRRADLLIEAHAIVHAQQAIWAEEDRAALASGSAAPEPMSKARIAEMNELLWPLMGAYLLEPLRRVAGGGRPAFPQIGTPL